MCLSPCVSIFVYLLCFADLGDEGLSLRDSHGRPIPFSDSDLVHILEDIGPGRAASEAGIASGGSALTSRRLVGTDAAFEAAAFEAAAFWWSCFC